MTKPHGKIPDDAELKERIHAATSLQPPNPEDFPGEYRSGPDHCISPIYGPVSLLDPDEALNGDE